MPYGSYKYNTGMWLSVPAAVKSLSFQVRNLKLFSDFRYVANVRFCYLLFFGCLRGKGTMFSDVPKKEYLCLHTSSDFRDNFSAHSMHKLAILLKKEFLQIFRDRFMLRVMVMLPIVQLLVLPLAANYDIKNFRMAAIDRDNTQFSRRLLTKMQAGGYFSLTESVPSWAQAERMIERGDVDMIVEIPDRFERDMVLGRSPELSVRISAINGLSAGVAAG